MREKVKVKITSHGTLNFEPYRGLRTPAEVELTRSQLEILKVQGVVLEEIKPEKSSKKQSADAS